MPYKHMSTQCVVRLIALRGLSAAQRSQCQALRAEAGRPVDGSAHPACPGPHAVTLAERQ
jgi:hypothetical protein